MLHLVRRSLLVQLLGVYALFVLVVLGTDLEVNAVAQQQVRAEVQTTDLALAQEVALDMGTELRGIEASLVQLSQVGVVRGGDTEAMTTTFQTFMAARQDLALVEWLGVDGTLQASYPPNRRTVGAPVLGAQLLARLRGASAPVMDAGIVDLTTFSAVATFAQPVHDSTGRLRGIVATDLLLSDLSASLQTVITAQAQQHQHLLISVVDAQGDLVASPEQERILQPVLDQLPGASAALAGHTATTTGTDAQGKQWIYSAVPIRSLGWAVVVQRPTAEILSAVTNFQRWIFVAAGIFALGGLLFWLVLLRRVVQPLHTLATRHAALPVPGSLAADVASPLAGRRDEIGALATSLKRLEHDVIAQLGELRTLLDTSNAVVTSLDPRAVGGTIIREVRRLVDVQAAAVLVPDEEGVLRVLVSEGRDAQYNQAVRIEPDDLNSPAALALHEGRAVQLIAGEGAPFPPLSLAEGFRAVLAIPIISRHVGGVVLLVHRVQALRFTAHEINLLLTFANYATLAWEHAVLYERSDERLREVAQENERLYRQATAEKQTLAALMSSMSDGLILTDAAGHVLFATSGAGMLTGVPPRDLEGRHIDTLHERLTARARDPSAYTTLLARVRAGESATWSLETEAGGTYQVVNLRLFDVWDDAGQAIGRGLLLRDVTREHEIDRFKTTLLAAVGHELRTPLAAIKGYASTLLQDDVAWSPEDEHRFLRTISVEADRLAELVSNLLDLSRMEAGLLLLRRAPWLLADLVDGAVRRLHGPAPDLTVTIPLDLPALQVDRTRIEVVLHNLLANALAYGNGHVEIRAELRGGAVLVHIADDGPGIGEDELPHIFERFYRATRGHQQRAGGTGLGLAICKAFVEAHGGAIWAESSARGTIITFSVPTAVGSADTGAEVGRLKPAAHAATAH